MTGVNSHFAVVTEEEILPMLVFLNVLCCHRVGKNSIFILLLSVNIHRD